MAEPSPGCGYAQAVSEAECERKKGLWQSPFVPLAHVEVAHAVQLPRPRRHLGHRLLDVHQIQEEAHGLFLFGPDI